METKEQIFMEINEQIFMEINEQIFMEIDEQIVRDVTFSLNLDDYIYNQDLKEFHIQRLRNKMGGDKGVHSIVKNTEDGN